MTKREAREIVEAIHALPSKRNYALENTNDYLAKVLNHLGLITVAALFIAGCVLLIALRVFRWI